MKLTKFIGLAILLVLNTIECRSELTGKDSYKFALIGDWGTVNEETENKYSKLNANANTVLDNMATKLTVKGTGTIDALIGTGDAAYLNSAYRYKMNPDDSITYKNNIYGIMNNFEDKVKGIFSGDKNFWTVLGNHECDNNYYEHFKSWTPTQNLLVSIPFDNNDKMITKTVTFKNGKVAIFHLLNFCILNRLYSGKVKGCDLPDVYLENNYGSYDYNDKKTNGFDNFINLGNDEETTTTTTKTTSTTVTRDLESLAYVTKIEEKLKAAFQNTNLAWHVVVMHNTFLSEGKEHGDSRQVIKHLLPLFQKYKVNLVINGHEHISQFATISSKTTVNVDSIQRPRNAGGIVLPNCEGRGAETAAIIRCHVLNCLSKIYAISGDTAVIPSAIYQTESGQNVSEISVNSANYISNVLIGNTEGRGMTQIGRTVALSGNTLNSTGKISIGETKYLNSLYFSWCTMDMTSTEIKITYYHNDRLVEPVLNSHSPKVTAQGLNSKTFTVKITKSRRRLIK